MQVDISLPKENIGVPYIYEFVKAARQLDLEDARYGVQGDIVVRGEIVYTGTAFRLSGRVFLERTFQCDRCLEEASEKQELVFEEEFKELESREKTADVQSVSFGGDAINISELIRETVLLSQPLNHICNAACKGLCPKCGANLNQGDCGCDRHIVDPRLAALQNFFQKN